MSEEKSSQFFASTKRFQAAVELINRVDSKKFPRLASTLLSQLQAKAKRTFSEEEEAQLCALFSFTQEQLDTVLDACTYIFEQAAYHNLKPERLTAYLVQAKLEQSQAEALGANWRDYRDVYLAKRRDHSFGAPLTLDDVSWRLQLSLADQSLSKTKDLNAIFNFTLANVDGVQDSTENLTVQFSPAQLKDFYEKIELIQKQIDFQ